MKLDYVSIFPEYFAPLSLSLPGKAVALGLIDTAVHDLRSWIDHLEATGVTQVGMTGLSLGGYLTSVMAAVDDRLHFAIPNAPVTDFDDLVELWHPAGAVVQAAMKLHPIWPAATMSPACRLTARP